MKAEKSVPSQEVRHTIKFTREEVAEALKAFAKLSGNELPDGKVYIWGIDDSRRDRHGKKSEFPLTIGVDVSPAKELSVA